MYLVTTKIILITCVTFVFYPLIHGDIFTSTGDIKRLTHSEDTLYHEIDSYIKQQEDKLAAMRKSLNKVKSQMDQIYLKGDDQKNHPIAIFLLFKRFLTNWKGIQKKINQQANDTGLLMSSFIYTTMYNRKRTSNFNLLKYNTTNQHNKSSNVYNSTFIMIITNI